MTTVQTKVPPEVAAVLTGRNPFLHHSQPSQVFRDVFDFGDQSLLRKDEDDEFGGKVLGAVSQSRETMNEWTNEGIWPLRVSFSSYNPVFVNLSYKPCQKMTKDQRKSIRNNGWIGLSKIEGMVFVSMMSLTSTSCHVMCQLGFFSRFFLLHAGECSWSRWTLPSAAHDHGAAHPETARAAAWPLEVGPHVWLPLCAVRFFLYRAGVTATM